MDATKQHKGLSLSFPIGTRENPINLDGEDNERTPSKRSMSAKTYGKATRKVRTTRAASYHMRLTVDRSEDIIIQSDPEMSLTSQATHRMLSSSHTASLSISTLSQRKYHFAKYLRVEAPKILPRAVSRYLVSPSGVNLTPNSPCHDFQWREYLTREMRRADL